MRVDSLQLRMRPRTPFEAADLGIRFCQQHWRSLHACHAAVTVPVLALCIASHELAAWLPLTLLFFAKPWIDRTSLFVLSRAAFGQSTRLGDLWAAQRQVWWSQLLLSWTWRRLSPWRSFTQPVYQLERLRGSARRRRKRQLGVAVQGPALLVTGTFMLAEKLFVIGLVALYLLMVPGEGPPASRLGELSSFAATTLPALYGIVVLFLEPYFVGAGFAMYLNRRAELEAWDIEQELRHAFTD